jgi:hypothetical protein
MTDDNSNYLLYQNLDHHLATLAKIYKADGKKEQLSIVVNSQVSFEGGVSYDNWNGGITGHALHFRVSESVFLATRKTHQKLASETLRMSSSQACILILSLATRIGGKSPVYLLDDNEM